MQELGNKISFDYADLDEAFPQVDPGVEPYGSRVLVQIRTPKKVTRGGIHLISEARETELYNTQTAKVIALGPLAFRNRTTLDQWKEGEWCAVGDFVRVTKYGGDRWSVVNATEQECIFVIFNDLDLVGKVTGDPRLVKAFL